MTTDPRLDVGSISEGFDPTEYNPPERLPRGQFTLDVYNVCVEYSKGKLLLKEGHFLTPSHLRRILMADQPEAKPPSTGSVAAVFHRWEDWGFAFFRQNPYAFLDFSDHGKEVGLKGILIERARLKAEDQALFARPR